MLFCFLRVPLLNIPRDILTLSVARFIDIIILVVTRFIIGRVLDHALRAPEKNAGMEPILHKDLVEKSSRGRSVIRDKPSQGIRRQFQPFRVSCADQ
jgi:hypothetical protein